MKSVKASWSMPSRMPLAVGVIRGASLVNSTSKLAVSLGLRCGWMQVEGKEQHRGKRGKGSPGEDGGVKGRREDE